MAQNFVKDPDAILDYEIDWTEWIGVDTISVSAWTVPTGITKTLDSLTSTTTTVWLSGGTYGADYQIINHITTAAGRQDDRTITVRVRNK